MSTPADAIVATVAARTMTGQLRPPEDDPYPGAADLELAPYALVRLAALPCPPAPPQSVPFRRAIHRVAQVHARLAAMAAPVCDALHASAGSHPARFHQRVVLPLRRDIHNGRQPRQALLAALDGLPERIPPLRTWLDTAALLAEAQARLAESTAGALRAERAVLALTCRDEAVRRAVTLVGADLLHGVDRAAAAGDTPDRRARKAEPNALRYALRATSKTSPLSWFTHVGWGEWSDDDRAGRAGGPPVATAQANRTLLAGVVRAVLDEADVRRRVRHRLAPALRAADGRLTFRRDIPVAGMAQVLGVREEQVEVGHTKPLGLLVEIAAAAGEAGVTSGELTATLVARLPGRPDETARVASAYVERMLDTGLLVPVEPCSPQDPEALGATADWLQRLDRPRLAQLLHDIAERTAAFGTTPADARGAAQERLREAWRAAHTAAGIEWRDAPPLTEDVSVRAPIQLGRASGRAAAADLPAVAALAEIFDQYLPVRRLVRDRFVARYGVGGHCQHATDFAPEIATAWRAAGLVAADGTVDRSEPLAELLTSPLRELAEVRAELTAAVHRAAGGDPEEVRIPESVVRHAARALPRWARGRPASYSFFVQPLPAGSATTLVVNHVYAGWGRFTSRFLDQVTPSAAPALAAQLRRTLGRQARIVQFRPVSGFNANLHPLVVSEEIGEDPAWAGVLADRVSLAHDPDTDQVRLRLADAGEPLDVLYLGFLVPFVFPDRLAHLHLDLGGGLVDLTHLAPAARSGDVEVRPRLRYRDLVLTRRSWRLPAAAAANWRADLHAGGDVPADAAARWMAKLGMPGEVFLAPARRAMPRSPEEFLRYLRQPKPQYVDLANALHLRCLHKLLARHDDGIRVEEALPVPGTGHPDGRVTELVAETYRRATRHD